MNHPIHCILLQTTAVHRGLLAARAAGCSWVLVTWVMSYMDHALFASSCFMGDWLSHTTSWLLAPLLSSAHLCHVDIQQRSLHQLNGSTSCQGRLSYTISTAVGQHGNLSQGRMNCQVVT